jgi:hypothetical protein
MTYKWEAIAQDLTEERDRLLEDNKWAASQLLKVEDERDRLKEALETAYAEMVMLKSRVGEPFRSALTAACAKASAALKSEKQ